MTTRRPLAVAMALLGLLLGGVGCEPQNGGGGDEGGKMTIAVIPRANVLTFWPAVRQGVEAACNELDVELIWSGAENERAYQEQVEIVETMILNDDVQGIVLAPLSASILLPVVKKATEAGKPVVILDSEVDGDHHVSLVATDDYQGGAIGAERLAKALGGQGKVALIRNLPNSAATEEREKGFLDTLKGKFPDVTLADEQYAGDDRTKGKDVTSAILAAHPDLGGVFAVNEPGAIGALDAVKAANKIGQVKIVGFDASPALVAGVRDGSIDSTLVQDPFTLGKRGVEILVAHLRGRQVPQEEKIPVKLVTGESLDTPGAQALLEAYGVAARPEARR